MQSGGDEFLWKNLQKEVSDEVPEETECAPKEVAFVIDDEFELIIKRRLEAQKILGLRNDAQKGAQEIMTQILKIKKAVESEINSAPKVLKDYIKMLESINRSIFCERCKKTNLKFEDVTNQILLFANKEISKQEAESAMPYL